MRLLAASARCALVLLAAVAACAAAQAGHADGSFATSDDQLTAIWQASVRTATDDLSPPVNLDSRDCIINLPVVILDSPIRDRCPYIGDLAVTGMTLLVSQSDVSALRAMIAWFASVQNPDGSIPASPIFDSTLILTDYNAYWVEALYDYTLYTGDLTLLQQVLPNLVKLMNVLYPPHVNGSGVLVDWIGGHDYAFIVRAGTEVAYFDAQYVRALQQASQLATWAGDAGDATAWLGRAQAASTAFAATFWDPVAGAYMDTTNDASIHALDGNVFAIDSGSATPQREQSILAYIDAHMATAEGDVVVDDPFWNFPHWPDDATDRIYPFIGYYDLLARYTAGDDDGALDLIRREWGFMLANGPGTMWETIDAATGLPTPEASSVDHGFSSGAAPILTGYLLGVLPTSPGFAAFTVTPHPSGVQAAEGDVPTPGGNIHVFWQLAGGTPQLSVTVPPGTTWSNAPPGPLNTSEPAVNGATEAGATLTASSGTWVGTAPIAYAFQWSSCGPGGLTCAPIAGETTASYVVQPQDVGQKLRVFVTATNAAGTTTAASLATAIPQPDTGGGDDGGDGGGGGGGSAPAPAPVPSTPVATPPVVPAPVVVAAPQVQAPPRYRLVVTVAGSGRVMPGSGRFAGGTRILLTARPAKGWRFSSWAGRWCHGKANTCRFRLTHGADVTARFVRIRPAQAASSRR